jgi:hypothetical protein
MTVKEASTKDAPVTCTFYWPDNTTTKVTATMSGTTGTCTASKLMTSSGAKTIYGDATDKDGGTSPTRASVTVNIT